MKRMWRKRSDTAQNPDAAPEALHCGVQVHHLIIQV